MPDSRLFPDFAGHAAWRGTQQARRGPAAAARAVRAAVARLAEIDPLTPPAAPHLLERRAEERDGLRVEHLRFAAAADGAELHAVLLAPAHAAQPLPAVLVSPGRNAVPAQVTGLEPADHPDRNIAERLARSGLLTLTPEYGFDDALPADRLAGRDPAHVLAAAAAVCGRPLLGRLVEDNLALLAWLAARDDVDPGRLGLFGHSLGAAVALHTRLLAARPLPLCTASHFGTYPVLYATTLSGSPAAALPGILRHADLPDLFAATAPGPLQVQYGAADGGLLAEDTAAAAAALRGAWCGDGVEEPELLELPMGHGTDPDRAAGFFERCFAGSGAGRGEPAVPPLRVHFDLAARRTVADRVDEALASGVLTLGPVLAEFEARARDWVGRRALGVASGSAALEVAFRAIGVTDRSVLIPVDTFFATASSALRAGARVRFVDMELEGLGTDPEALERELDLCPDAAAVAVVHLGGYISPAIARVAKLCEERGVALVEDAAHAFGSRLDGRFAGGFGDFGAFSMYPTKVLTSAKGGILTSATEQGFDLASRLRDHGKSGFESALHDTLGGNWRLSEVHAALALAQLETFAEQTARRRELAARYDAALADLPGLTPFRPAAGVESSGYKYLAFLADDVDRAELKSRLRERHGVGLAGEVYPTLLPEQPYFAGHETASQEYPRARWFADRHIALPLYPSLTEREQERVIAALRAQLGGGR